MKILHLSDLHLGAKTEGFLRISEQKSILSEIEQIANSNNIDIIAIAGDIFHVANPSAEAEDLFYSFLENLTKDKNRVVLVVAGNHDDPKRLACCQPLAKSHNIVLCTDLSPLPTYKPNGSVVISQTGRGFAKIQKGTEAVCAALLPYATKSRIEQSTKDLNFPKTDNYQQNVQNWLKFASQKFEKSAFNLLVAHQYVVGAKEMVGSKEQKVSVGSALSVPISVFPNADYIALGHLHTSQLVAGSKNIYYSGSTIKLRLYDQAPSVLIVDTKTKQTKKVSLKSCYDIKKVEAENASDAIKKLSLLQSTDLVYLQLTKTNSITALDIKEIKQQNSTVVSITFKSNQALKNNNFVDTKNMTPAQLFDKFVEQKTGKPAPENLINMFLSILEESNETNNS